MGRCISDQRRRHVLLPMSSMSSVAAPDGATTAANAAVSTTQTTGRARFELSRENGARLTLLAAP
jgi:hypothetical protein